ncbi:UNVERIFIED_CONTAM: hypothetical protein K2H54_014652 [Gekko kuhli]
MQDEGLAESLLDYCSAEASAAKRAGAALKRVFPEELPAGGEEGEDKAQPTGKFGSPDLHQKGEDKRGVCMEKRATGQIKALGRPVPPAIYGKAAGARRVFQEQPRLSAPRKRQPRLVSPAEEASPYAPRALSAVKEEMGKKGSCYYRAGHRNRILSEVGHTQGPLDGSLYAKVKKKDSLHSSTGAVNTNRIALSAAPNHIEHTLSVSSDSGNSTASTKTDKTDEQAVPAVPSSSGGNNPVLTPEEKQELESLLSGFGLENDAAMHNHHPGGGAAMTSAASGRHVVPAQVHVNGEAARLVAERETDILDDELPNQDEHSVGSLGTLSSFDGTTNTSDMGYHEAPQMESLSSLPNGSPNFNGIDKLRGSETVINGGYPYNNQNTLRSMMGRHPQDPYGHIQPSVSAQENLADYYQHVFPTPGWLQPQPLASTQPYPYSYDPNGIYRSQTFPTATIETPQLPQAPARSMSSREAVQRGLNSWQQQSGSRPPSRPQDGTLESLSPSFSSASPQPSPSQTAPPQSISIPEFPRVASQREIEQSIEALNMLMLDLDPSVSTMQKSQSVPVATRNDKPCPMAFSMSAQPVAGAQVVQPRPANAFGPIPGSPTHVSTGTSVSQLPEPVPKTHPRRLLLQSPREPEYSAQDYREAYLPYGYQSQQPSVTPAGSYGQAAGSPPVSPRPHVTAHKPVEGQHPLLTSPASPTMVEAQIPGKDVEDIEEPSRPSEEEPLHLEGLVAHRVAGTQALLVLSRSNRNA